MTTPSALQGRQQLCNCWARTRRSMNCSRWYSVFTEETYQHDSNCPRSKTADYSRSVAAQFIVCSRVVGLCIQAGWQCSRRGGWNSIAPMLRYCAVVPSNSGAFKVLNDALTSLSSRRIPQNEDWDDRLTSVITTLRQTLGTSASPYDIDEYGHGLFHVCVSQNLSHFILNLTGRVAHDRTVMFGSLFGSLQLRS
jgi:hypothetical protein